VVVVEGFFHRYGDAQVRVELELLGCRVESVGFEVACPLELTFVLEIYDYEEKCRPTNYQCVLWQFLVEAPRLARCHVKVQRICGKGERSKDEVCKEPRRLS
jgi:hypothetical protein